MIFLGKLPAPGMRFVDIVTISRKQATRAMRKSEAFPGNRVKPGRRRIRGHHNVNDLQRQARASGGRFSLTALMYGLAALFGGAPSGPR
jgi:hypothetical protein